MRWNCVLVMLVNILLNVLTGHMQEAHDEYIRHTYLSMSDLFFITPDCVNLQFQT